MTRRDLALELLLESLEVPDLRDAGLVGCKPRAAGSHSATMRRAVTREWSQTKEKRAERRREAASASQASFSWAFPIPEPPSSLPHKSVEGSSCSWQLKEY